MHTERVIYAIEPIGSGQGRIRSGEIDTDDITIAVSQPFGSPDSQGNRPKRSVWLDDDIIDSYVSIQEPASKEQSYDAVVIIAGAPVPDGFDVNEELTIDISIAQIRQAKAAECPGCGNDLRETFEKGGCTICGFYFDGDHLSDNRRTELDRRRDEYNG